MQVKDWWGVTDVAQIPCSAASPRLERVRDMVLRGRNDVDRTADLELTVGMKEYQNGPKDTHQSPMPTHAERKMNQGSIGLRRVNSHRRQ